MIKELQPEMRDNIGREERLRDLEEYRTKMTSLTQSPNLQVPEMRNHEIRDTNHEV